MYSHEVIIAFITLAILSADPTPPEPGSTPCKPLGASETIRVDLDDVPLIDVARFVSCALERNILIDPPLLGQKRVTVLGPRPIGRRDLETLWQAVLVDNGLVAETHGAYERVRAARP